MRKRNKIILPLTIILFLFGMFSSCEDYLDKAEESDISEENVFVDFRSFQGFTEELYSAMPDMSKCTWTCEWNFADELFTTTGGTFRLNYRFDIGDYWAWNSGGFGWDNSWLDDNGANTDPGNNHNKGLYDLCWYGLRKANLGLENLELLTDATQEERNIIEGQLLFFRGFFHFQLMSFWGGLPYIDKTFGGNDVLDLARLSYQETALLAAADFEAAANLLPANWDATTVGQATLGDNNQRLTKSVAYAYLGKNLLYAASPLMNKASTGSGTFDTDLCVRAADAFYNVLALSDSGDAVYDLLPWEDYSENFYTISSYSKHPGYPEVLWGPPSYASWQSRWGLAGQFVPAALGGDAIFSTPAANYVNNYGMANGLPIDEADSGYDISDPWSNRDPRFHEQIIVDGDRLVLGSGGSDEYRYANLYNNGNLRNESAGSRSGYMWKKFIPAGCNNVDNVWNNGINIIVPYLRLADVYLMYAEAVLQGYGSAQSSSNGYITAEDAVNVVRARANVPNVDARFTGSKDVFMEQIIKERAVELSFEGLRFHDLRRWMLFGETKYKEKTAIDFDRGDDGKPINYTEKLIYTRVFEEKHYWLPLPTGQVNLYPEYYQNPGW